MLSLETMIAVKFGRGLYPQPWPRHVLVSWAVVSAAFVTVLLVWQIRLWLYGSDGSSSSGGGGGNLHQSASSTAGLACGLNGKSPGAQAKGCGTDRAPSKKAL